MRLKYDSLATLCLLLLALLPASCIQDEYAAKEKATVRVTFTTRADGGTTVVGSGLAENERMHTLRVIVANGNDILYNVYYTNFETDEDGRYYKTITFSELTTVKGTALDFYAIANESGLGDDIDLSKVTIDGLKAITLGNSFLTNANAVNSSTLIPQTAHEQIPVNPTDGSRIQEETMELKFAVAKVRLTIENTSTEPQTVRDISLSGVNMTSTPLFAGTSLSSTYTEGTVDLDNMQIPAGESRTVYSYFYENKNSTGYTLTAFWKKDQTLLLQTGSDDNKQPITEIPRGKMLDITIKLNADVDIESTINVQVDEWTGKTIDVPPFQ